MPFTLAHAAAALPLRRLKLVWSAFVIGTFAPDFETFVLLTSQHRDMHRFPGLLLYTLPSGLLVLWTFHRWLKAPLVELAPEGLRVRLLPYVRRFAFGGVRRFSAIVGSMALGIATHLLWDEFTHPGWISEHLAWFSAKQVVPWFDGPHFPTHLKLLQGVSSVLGCVALVIWAWHWYGSTAPARGPVQPVFAQPMRSLLAAFILSAPWAVALWLAFSRGHDAEDFAHVSTFARYFVLLPAAVLVFELLVFALFTTWLRAQHRTESA